MGSAVQAAEAFTEGTVTIQAKHQLVKRVDDKLATANSVQHLPKGSASKLRGDLVWLGCHAHGRLGQIALGVLRMMDDHEWRQFGNPHVSDQEFTMLLEFLRKVVLELPPRIVLLTPSQRMPTPVYSDASFKDER